MMLSLQLALSEQDTTRIRAHSMDVLQYMGIDYKATSLLEILQTHSQTQLPEGAEIKILEELGEADNPMEM